MDIADGVMHVGALTLDGVDMETLTKRMAGQYLWPALMVWAAAAAGASTLPEVEAWFPDCGWDAARTLNLGGATASIRSVDTEYAFAVLDAEDKVVFGILRD